MLVMDATHAGPSNAPPPPRSMYTFRGFSLLIPFTSTPCSVLMDKLASPRRASSDHFFISCVQPLKITTTTTTTKGLFLAPTIVGESLKGAFLLAEVFGGTFGFPTNPPPPVCHQTTATPPVDISETAPEHGISALPTEAVGTGVLGARYGSNAGLGGGAGGGSSVGVRGVAGRTDIVQALELGSRDRLVRFCVAVQALSPVNAYVKPGE